MGLFKPQLYFYFQDRDVEPPKEYLMNVPMLRGITARTEIAIKYGVPFFTHNPTNTTYHVNAIYAEGEQGNGLTGAFMGLVLGILVSFGNAMGTCGIAAAGMLLGFYQDYINRKGATRFNRETIPVHMEDVDPFTMKVKAEKAYKESLSLKQQKDNNNTNNNENKNENQQAVDLPQQGTSENISSCLQKSAEEHDSNNTQQRDDDKDSGSPPLPPTL